MRGWGGAAWLNASVLPIAVSWNPAHHRLRADYLPECSCRCTCTPAASPRYFSRCSAALETCDWGCAMCAAIDLNGPGMVRSGKGAARHSQTVICPCHSKSAALRAIQNTANTFSLPLVFGWSRRLCLCGWRRFHLPDFFRPGACLTHRSRGGCGSV